MTLLNLPTWGDWPHPDSATSKAKMDLINEAIREMKGAKVSVLSRGADDSGAVDCSAAFAETWLDSGGLVYAPKGVFRLTDEAFVGSSPLVLEGDGPNNTIINLENVNLAQITGSIATAVLLTASVALGATTLTMASTAGIVAGDYLVLRDTAQVLPGTTSSPYAGVVGEIVQVKSVDSGTVVTIWGAVEQAMTLTSGNLSVRKLTPVDTVIIRNLTLRNPFPSTFTGGNARGVQFTYCKNILVENVQFVKLDDDGVNLDTCVDWDVVGCNFYDLQNTGGRTPYGVVASNGCVNGRVHRCRQVNGRHLFTTGGDDGEIGPAHVEITNNQAYGCPTNPYDTHPAGREIGFISNECHGCAGGVHLRTPKSRIADFKMLGGAAAAGVTFGGTATGSVLEDSEIRGVTTAVDVQAEDCDVRRSKVEGSAYGVRVRGSVDLVGAAIVKARVRDIHVVGNPSVGPVVMNGTDTATRIIERIYAPDSTTLVSPSRPSDLEGAGTPEGNVVAAPGSTYRRRNGGAGTSFYVKESGTGNTGWTAK